jgi:hypothetical protein
MRTLICPRRGMVRLAASCCCCRSIVAAGGFLLTKARESGDWRAVWLVSCCVWCQSEWVTGGRRRLCRFIAAECRWDAGDAGAWGLGIGKSGGQAYLASKELLTEVRKHLEHLWACPFHYSSGPSLRPCLVHSKIKKFSKFFVTSNLRVHAWSIRYK